MNWTHHFQRGAAFIYKASRQPSLPMSDLITFGARDYYMTEANDSPMLDWRYFLQKRKVIRNNIMHKHVKIPNQINPFISFIINIFYDFLKFWNFY